MLIERDERSKKVKHALERIMSGGTKIANIAVKLDVSPWTINSWKTGRRIPSDLAIRSLEREYRIKVL